MLAVPPPLPVNSASALEKAWLDAWPRALETWSKFTRLRSPKLCLTRSAAKEDGLTGSFAMIRLQDQAIVVDLPEVIACGLQDYGVEILAHEIGHHVLAPATLTDHGRTIARMRWALPTVEQHAPMVANLYTDLLINDRLQRSANLRLADIYRRLGKDKAASGAVWALYIRVYEILWRLERGSLHGGKTDDRLEGDAWLGARLIRSFARDWLDGAGRFAALLLPHLLEDKRSQEQLQKWFDTREAGIGGSPSGLINEDAQERAGAIHPAQDSDLSGNDNATTEESETKNAPPKPVNENQLPRGQAREPFQYGEILRALGIKISDHDAAVRYYKERARSHLISFPSREAPESLDPLPEGLEPWEIGQPFDEIDWIETIMQSPRVIPGLTTVQRVWGTSPGTSPERVPLDLDLYVDSSGSMPNPQHMTSYLTLAGAIMALSALRAGARVQVTLWSGKNQFMMTDGFMRDETEILRILTGFYGGATAFPTHVLRDTFSKRSPKDRLAHIMVISDDGISTLFDMDEKGNSGWDVSKMALKNAGGGGTFVLNLPKNWEEIIHGYQIIRRARDEGGWQVHAISSWDQLVEFARQFSQLRYGQGSLKPRRAAAKAETSPKP